jgi:hypothetical protein
VKPRLLIIYSIIYSLAVLSFCIYWASIFTRYTTYKGDELFKLVQVLLVLTYLFFLTIQFTVKRINFFIALLTPILTSIMAFCLGMLVFAFTHLSGISRQYILIYGLLYELTTLIAVYRFWGRAQKKI